MAELEEINQDENYKAVQIMITGPLPRICITAGLMLTLQSNFKESFLFNTSYPGGGGSFNLYFEIKISKSLHVFLHEVLKKIKAL